MKSTRNIPTSKSASTLAVVFAVLCTLCFGQIASAQQGSALKLPTPPKVATPAAAAQPKAAQAGEEEKEAASPAKPGSEGIKVHGHWKFVVKNADGTVASTREFENSLISGGQGDQLLSGLLSGNYVIGDWGIVLCPNPGAYAGVCPGGGAPVAVITTNPNGSLGSQLQLNVVCGLGCVGGLTSAAVVNAAGVFSLVLAGSYTAPSNLSINGVSTIASYCGSGLRSSASPAACIALSATAATPNPTAGNSELLGSLLTGTPLAAPQSLTAGQILQVTVTLSFS